MRIRVRDEKFYCSHNVHHKLNPSFGGVVVATSIRPADPYEAASNYVIVNMLEFVLDFNPAEDGSCKLWVEPPGSYFEPKELGVYLMVPCLGKLSALQCLSPAAAEALRRAGVVLLLDAMAPPRDAGQAAVQASL